ncbi:MAG: hypothetical protein JWN98_2400 [Abditibacteriota bacterium]|nr:hypothetical protein [Abditibacteriota bacterium]
MNSDPHGQFDAPTPACDVQPTFSCSTPHQAQEVTLQRENYIKLLVDARVTDPACWPPGLEVVAGMIERVCDIEEACIEQYGEFDPEKLTAQDQDEYMDLHLVLDAIQENADMEEVAELIAETSVANSQATALAASQEVATSNELLITQPIPKPDIWPSFPTLQENDNFA